MRCIYSTQSLTPICASGSPIQLCVYFLPREIVAIRHARAQKQKKRIQRDPRSGIYFNVCLRLCCRYIGINLCWLHYLLHCVFRVSVFSVCAHNGLLSNRTTTTPRVVQVAGATAAAVVAFSPAMTHRHLYTIPSYIGFYAGNAHGL